MNIEGKSTVKKSGALVGAVLLCLTASAGETRAGTSASYPYKSAAFTRFVADSYKEANAGDPRQFYRWMETACARQYPNWPGWTATLAAHRRRIAAIQDPTKRAKAEMTEGAWLHKTIKTIIPKFSLDRGFEFVQTVNRSERQCFLQGTLIAGLLQAEGINAGVVMIYKNDKGQTTNNGHAAALVKLSNGKDVIVDASDPTPFVAHQGLFSGRGTNYNYVAPIYKNGSPLIWGYKKVGDGAAMATRQFQTLDTDFLRSQFDYYRGERTPGGLLDAKITGAGLAEEARHLRVSGRECAQNPLAVYMLGRVYWKQKKLAAAKSQLKTARALYIRDGWLADGCKDAIAGVNAASSPVKVGANR